MFDRVYYENNKDSEQTHVRDKGRILVYCYQCSGSGSKFLCLDPFCKDPDPSTTIKKLRTLIST
jgi:hypothetical protein